MPVSRKRPPRPARFWTVCLRLYSEEEQRCRLGYPDTHTKSRKDLRLAFYGQAKAGKIFQTPEQWQDLQRRLRLAGYTDDLTYLQRYTRVFLATDKTIPRTETTPAAAAVAVSTTDAATSPGGKKRSITDCQENDSHDQDDINVRERLKKRLKLAIGHRLRRRAALLAHLDETYTAKRKLVQDFLVSLHSHRPNATSTTTSPTPTAHSHEEHAPQGSDHKAPAAATVVMPEATTTARRKEAPPPPAADLASPAVETLDHGGAVRQMPPARVANPATAAAATTTPARSRSSPLSGLASWQGTDAPRAGAAGLSQNTKDPLPLDDLHDDYYSYRPYYEKNDWDYNPFCVHDDVLEAAPALAHQELLDSSPEIVPDALDTTLPLPPPHTMTLDEPETPTLDEPMVTREEPTATVVVTPPRDTTKDMTGSPPTDPSTDDDKSNMEGCFPTEKCPWNSPDPHQESSLTAMAAEETIIATTTTTTTMATTTTVVIPHAPNHAKGGFRNILISLTVWSISWHLFLWYVLGVESSLWSMDEQYRPMRVCFSMERMGGRPAIHGMDHGNLVHSNDHERRPWLESDIGTASGSTMSMSHTGNSMDLHRVCSPWHGAAMSLTLGVLVSTWILSRLLQRWMH